VHAGSAKDVDAAVKAAKAALNNPSWKLLPGTDRGILMGKLADLIEANKEVLASVEAWDNGMYSGKAFQLRGTNDISGKPYSVALTEDLPETINTFRYYSGWADKIFGQTIGTTHQKFAYTLRQPIGVVAQIIPWNYVCANSISPRQS
jgi:aldehyde dehydrogenase (NAD+)